VLDQIAHRRETDAGGRDGELGADAAQVGERSGESGVRGPRREGRRDESFAIDGIATGERRRRRGVRRRRRGCCGSRCGHRDLTQRG